MDRAPRGLNGLYIVGDRRSVISHIFEVVGVRCHVSISCCDYRRTRIIIYNAVNIVMVDAPGETFISGPGEAAPEQVFARVPRLEKNGPAKIALFPGIAATVPEHSFIIVRSLTGFGARIGEGII